MTATGFPKALPLVLMHEGGFVNDPEDNGGATNQGITQATYDDWRSARPPLRSVRFITPQEVAAIYRQRYWDRCRCDQLPAGVDYCVFDFAVNSGTARARRYLQRALYLAQDGIIGPVTLRAAAAADRDVLIEDICALRLAFLKRQHDWPHFGKGWAARVRDVELRAKGMSA